MTFSSKLDIALYAGKGLTIAAASFSAADYIVPMWGTGPYSFVLGAIGAAMSYGWELNQPSKKPKDTGLVIVIKTAFVTLFAVSLVVVVPDLFNWNLMPKSEPPLTFIIALYGRHIYPALKEAIPNIVKGLGNALGNRSGGNGGYDDYRNFPEDPGPPGRRERDQNEPPSEGGY